MIIAIDGPSGSGKSSVSRGVAQALGARYLDTGAMYRAVTWWMLTNGIDITDAQAVAAAAVQCEVNPSTDPTDQRISVGGTDVTAAIRGDEVTAAVSAVSAVPAVRERLVAMQRDIAAAGDIVVEGRDIAGVVLPHAQVKVFLTADPVQRAARRALQDGASTAHAQTTMARRDQADSTRAVSPLEQAPGSVLVDSTHMDLDEVVAAVLEMAETHGPA